ncbi:MAG: aldehyde dehydrogenase family protein [Cyclobacteriaceae bacterium]
MNTVHTTTAHLDLIPQLFEQQKLRSLALRDEPVERRVKKLKRLKKWIKRHRSAIQDAIYQDFRKPTYETDGSEILFILQEINHAIKYLSEWASPQKVRTPVTLPGTSANVQYEPKGVCLIMAPWNYPFQLLVAPWVSAIAAGNCCILKPSEMAPHTSELIFEMVASILPRDEAVVLQGDQEVAEALLKQPFDHIFFTGSTPVGKIIMKAAAENLSSVTLELGGKSPTIVDETANIKVAAKKIAWGKFMNAGQTCIAPDYILVHESVHDSLVEHLRTTLQTFYQPNQAPVEQSTDYARIINQKHFDRLREALEEAVSQGATVAIGGQHHAESRFMAPTVLTNVPADTTLMREEIFGPILPIRKYRTLPEAVDYINNKPKPLAQYVFSEEKRVQKYILRRTSAGGVTVNDVILHISHPDLPFGGVSHSGMGKAHGRYGFLEFSNQKAVLKQKWGVKATQVLYPPYTDRFKRAMDRLLQWI